MENIYHSGQYLQFPPVIDEQKLSCSVQHQENLRLLDSLSEFFVTDQCPTSEAAPSYTTSETNLQYSEAAQPSDVYIDRQESAYSPTAPLLTDDRTTIGATDLCSNANANAASASDDILSQATRSIMDQGIGDDYFPGAKRMRAQNNAGR